MEAELLDGLNHEAAIWRRAQGKQFSRPNADVIGGGSAPWSDVNGGDNDGDLFDEINGTSENDSPYMDTTMTGGLQSALFTFGMSPLTDPGIDTDHIMRVRASEFVTIDIGNTATRCIIELYSGLTLITTFNANGTGIDSNLFTLTHNIAPAAAALITEYDNLALNVSAASGANHVGTTIPKISWVELEVPQLVDEFGNTFDNFVWWTDIEGRFEYLTGNERRDGQETAFYRQRFIVDAGTDITEADQLVFDGKKYQIGAVYIRSDWDGEESHRVAYLEEVR